MLYIYIYRNRVKHANPGCSNLFIIGKGNAITVRGLKDKTEKSKPSSRAGIALRLRRCGSVSVATPTVHVALFVCPVAAFFRSTPILQEFCLSNFQKRSYFFFFNCTTRIVISRDLNGHIFKHRSFKRRCTVSFYLSSKVKLW